MNQRIPHTEPTTNSYAAAYGDECMYDGFGGSAQASHGVAWRHTVTELSSSAWITTGSGDACTERSRSVNQHLQPACRRGRYFPLRQTQGKLFGESFIDQRTNHDIRFKFTTKEEDSETGYSYFGARYYDSDISIWLSVDPMASKYPSISAYMYCAGNPVMLVDPDGRDIFIYYVGPKTSVTGLMGHTALGANNGGDSKISYFPASGDIAVWKKHEHTTPDGGAYYTYSLDENKTMKKYAKNGEYIVRMRLKLPKEVENIIKSQIDAYIETGGYTSLGSGGSYCTTQVYDVIYGAYLEAGYSEEDAAVETDRIIYFSTPENPSNSEKKEMGVTEYTVFYETNDKVVTKSYLLNNGKFKLQNRKLILGSENQSQTN